LDWLLWPTRIQHKSTSYFQFRVSTCSWHFFFLLTNSLWTHGIEKPSVWYFKTKMPLGQQLRAAVRHSLMTFTNVLIEFNLRHYKAAPCTPTSSGDQLLQLLTAGSTLGSGSELSLQLQNWFEFQVNVNVLQF